MRTEIENNTQLRAAQKVLRQFERATRNHEMKGVMPPDAWKQIEREWRQAKRAMQSVLRERFVF